MDAKMSMGLGDKDEKDCAKIALAVLGASSNCAVTVSVFK